MGAGRDLFALRKDGSEFQVEIGLTPLAVEDQTWTVATVVDISARKQAEEELRQSREDLCRAQSVGQIGSWRLDTHSNVLTWSDETYRIFGIPKGAVLTYQTFLSTVHPGDREIVEKSWEAALKGRAYDIEHRIVVGGEVKWVREKAYLEFSVGGELLGGFGIAQDITARKNAELQLAASLEELRLAQQDLVRKERLATLGRLAGSVAHEIRTPLSIIQNTGFFLEQTLQSGDETTREALEELKRAVASSNHIITEMLDYVREPHSNSTDFPIVDAISAALRLVPLPEKVQLQPRSGAGLVVRANQDQTIRILVNLIQNAVDSMPNGGQLAINAISQEDQTVCVEVTDTGCGIAQENLERIFEPLFSTKVKGIGLGLAIAKRYAELNDGTLSVESELGRGATFRLMFKSAPQEPSNE